MCIRDRIIVEHAFIDRASDASKLSQASFRKQLGQADATGVAPVSYTHLKRSIEISGKCTFSSSSYQY